MKIRRQTYLWAVSALMLALTSCGNSANAGAESQDASKSPALSNYFAPVTKPEAKPDADGFIRRWSLLEPIAKPNRSNTVFVDSYLRQAFTETEYFPGQFTVIPNDGDQVTVGEQTLTWHQYDSKLFNIKLFRFATGLEKERYGVLFWGVTVINCAEDIPNVKLAAGSNSASMWWVNGNEALILSGDRRMVMDDGMSAPLTLKKGKNILRVAVINGPGMSDFCVRFVDAEGKPVKNFQITNN